MAGTRGGSNGSGTGTGRGAAMIAPGRVGLGGGATRESRAAIGGMSGKGEGTEERGARRLVQKRKGAGMRAARMRRHAQGRSGAWFAPEMGVTKVNGGGGVSDEGGRGHVGMGRGLVVSGNGCGLKDLNGGI